ncbi:JAB domain-containing protein [Entomobacter blattae]|uniref:RadC-like JAB domain protein n=1 Tax=Entomobacter blattae TaxID=2762277 RepID=A0A7H1NS08_9PROT|nr:DNA repair protein RadC [Entomobacter blattae]QNT78568.1 RadC-like JAB domain protein [Entomobacter blattae]
MSGKEIYPSHRGDERKNTEGQHFFWGSFSEEEKITAWLSFFMADKGAAQAKARSYCAEYGTFAELCAAEHEGKVVLFPPTEQTMVQKQVIEEMSIRLLYSHLGDRNVLDSPERIASYFMACLSWQKNEQFRVLFLDENSNLLADKVLFSGTVDFVPVYPRQVALQILSLGAKGIVLVHNHPGGDPTPSKEDDALTRRMRKICILLGCELKDHMIISRGGWVSMAQSGML